MSLSRWIFDIEKEWFAKASDPSLSLLFRNGGLSLIDSRVTIYDSTQLDSFNFFPVFKMTCEIRMRYISLLEIANFLKRIPIVCLCESMVGRKRLPHSTVAMSWLCRHNDAPRVFRSESEMPLKGWRNPRDLRIVNNSCIDNNKRSYSSTCSFYFVSGENPVSPFFIQPTILLRAYVLQFTPTVSG